jgi:hypothetical protein
MIDITGIARIPRPQPRAPKAAPTCQNVSLDGFTRFYIGVNVSAEDMRHWSAQKIADFFQGVAKIVHAADDRNWQRRK